MDDPRTRPGLISFTRIHRNLPLACTLPLLWEKGLDYDGSEYRDDESVTFSFLKDRPH